VDDIPFPETQNYVKRILGTAEDYRRLYGGGVLAPLATAGASAVSLSLPEAGPPAKPAATKPAARRRRSSL
jgi:hypothetical protein